MTDIITDEIARAAAEYRARCGWLPVLVHGAADGCCSCTEGNNCGSAGKHPRFDGWHLLDPSDEEIADWFKQYPGSNIGVALGPCSGIVDFETDDEAGEQWLLDLFDGNLPPVPTFQSRKGKHRLFQFRADLPAKGHRGINQGTDNDRVRIADLKLGNGKHRDTGHPLGTQSVFPPSLHASGARYQWLITPHEAPPAALPDSVVAKIIAHCTPEIPKLHSNGSTPVSTSQAIDRCRKYVAKMDPAISGQGGHDRTFNVACEIFRFGLSERDAASVLDEFNQRCQPPWGEWDLQHKLQDALDEVLGAGEFGKRLTEERPAARSNGKFSAAKHEGSAESGQETDQLASVGPIQDDVLLSLVPADCIANAVVVQADGDAPSETFALKIAQIVELVLKRTGDWPRRVGNQLFVHDNNRGLHWLSSPDELFGWLQGRVGQVQWRQAPNCVRRPELFAWLAQVVTAYEAVEEYPHFPPLLNHYYCHSAINPGDGTALNGLLERFSPATAIDADLLKAAVVTPFWGGEPGSRPAMVIVSDDGRGVGKTTLAKAIARLCGGLFDMSHGEAIDVVKKRLLTTEALSKRVVLFDNLKTNKLSWAELEALITANVISGHRLYAGERTRPNTLTWTLTLNGPAMAKDMAQRSVVIKLKRPEHTGTWEDDLNAYIEANRWAIIADIAAFFTSTAVTLGRFTRWAAWERAILARLPEPGEAQAIIVERQGAIDADQDEAGEFEDFVACKLEGLGYDAEQEWVFIPNIVGREWLSKVRGEHVSTTAMTRMINQWANEGTAKAVRLNPSHKNGRGLLWRKCPQNSAVSVDLEKRIREYCAIGDDFRS